MGYYNCEHTHYYENDSKLEWEDELLRNLAYEKEVDWEDMSPYELNTLKEILKDRRCSGYYCI